MPPPVGENMPWPPPRPGLCYRLDGRHDQGSLPPGVAITSLPPRSRGKTVRTILPWAFLR